MGTTAVTRSEGHHEGIRGHPSAHGEEAVMLQQVTGDNELLELLARLRAREG